MSISTTQEDVYLSIETPLETDDLVLKRFLGRERLSCPFEFDLSMVSEKSDLDFASIIGQEVTVTIGLDDQERVFNGIIGEFVQGHTDYTQETETTYYTAKLYPKVWQLKYTRDCRIFQSMTPMEIVSQILQDAGVSSFEDRTQTRGQSVREYCVQFNESNFDFISRVLEQEGIFYFFEHSQGDHKFVMADSTDSYQACLNAETAELEQAKTSVDYLNALTSLSIQQSVIPQQYDIADFDYENPSTNLFSTVEGQGDEGKVYEYPGHFKDQQTGESDISIRMEEVESLQKRVQGTSTIPFFTPGYTSTFSGLSREEANKQYTLYEVQHKAELGKGRKGALYENSFVAFDAQVIYRPKRKTPRPVVSGTQTAFVTGKQGEEIWTDAYGRIKIKFHWDQLGQDDESSSCWVRVAQGLADSSWGMLFTPRIGQEVVVSFLNGDPDRPLVTGSVYNGEKLPPYLADEPTKSTIKTNSSKGGEGYNEIRFDDLKESEELYIRAEKDLNILVQDARSADVQGSDTLTVGGDRSTTVTGDEEHTNEQNHTHTIKQDRTITVNGDETHTNDQNFTHTVEQERSVTVTGDESHTNSADFSHDVSGNYNLTVNGNLDIQVTGDVTINGRSLDLQAQTSVDLQSGTSTSIAASTDLSMRGMNINVSATTGLNASGTMIDMSAKASATVSASGMTSISGAMVKVN